MAAVSYADKNYQRKKELYSVLVQCLEDIKYGTSHTQHAWNAPVEHLKGVTMRLLGEEHLELTYHRYEVTTVEGLTRLEDDGKKFLAEVVKDMKKKFRKYTGKTLKLKEIKADRAIEKASKISAEAGWLFGSLSRGGSPAGRYLIRDSKVFQIDASL